LAHLRLFLIYNYSFALSSIDKITVKSVEPDTINENCCSNTNLPATIGDNESPAGIVTLVIKSTGDCSTLVGFDMVSDIALSKSIEALIEPDSAIKELSIY
jgi:hypothetical protein